jgi:hypothetical protein
MHRIIRSCFAPPRPASPRRTDHRRASPVANVLILAFAILLCLVNALVWTFVSDMPLMGVAWVLTAAGCFWLQKWSKW